MSVLPSALQVPVIVGTATLSRDNPILQATIRAQYKVLVLGDLKHDSGHPPVTDEPLGSLCLGFALQDSDSRVSGRRGKCEETAGDNVQEPAWSSHTKSSCQEDPGAVKEDRAPNGWRVTLARQLGMTDLRERHE